MPIKILGVDDNQVICFVVASALKPYDCIVCQAANGEEGLAAALSEKPDLIISDISMPEMDGIEMITKLREHPEFAQTPVIMLTAWSGQRRLLQAKNLGVREYLVKPFTIPQLIEKVGCVIPLQLKSSTPDPVPPSPAPANPAAPGLNTSFITANTYGLSVPEPVNRLAQMVSAAETDLPGMSRVITKDPTLTARLLSSVNARSPGAGSPISSVDEALARDGIGCVYLLVMGDLVIRALFKTMQNMAGIKLEMIDPAKALFPIGVHTLCEVEFSGRALGKIDLHFDQRSAATIATNILGAKPSSKLQIDDVFRELTNIIVGNFLSKLSDTGLQSRLSAPRIRHTEDIRVASFSGGISERLAFNSVEATVFLDVSIDPGTNRQLGAEAETC